MDRKFESSVTQWFMHHELCTDPDRAEAWHYFAHDFAPKHKSFSVGDLEDGLAMKLMPHHPTHFGRGSSMIKVIARKIIQCYTDTAALGALGIMTPSGSKKFAVERPTQLGPWKSSGELKSAYK
jgi:hypothetical protein